MKRYPRGDENARRAARRDGRYRRTYGIGPDELEALREAQGGMCKICGKSGRLELDHCHRSGVRRGLLCTACNSGLGQFKDNPALLARAMAYLADHGTALKLA